MDAGNNFEGLPPAASRGRSARGRSRGKGRRRAHGGDTNRDRGRKRAKTLERGLDSDSDIARSMVSASHTDRARVPFQIPSLRTQLRIAETPASASASSFDDDSRGFIVQCAECFKWRVVPNKQDYEMIRARKAPFVCEEAAEWADRVSCELPTDVTPEDHPQICMMDRWGIPAPPPGWQRVISVRGPAYRSRKFADVYYYAPCGRKLRSCVEIRKYGYENLGFADEETLDAFVANFNFLTPRPLTDFFCVVANSQGKSKALS